MAWVLGHKGDFEEWKDTFKCDNFSYNHIFNSFKKSEKVNDSTLTNRGTTGPLNIRLCNRTELIDKFVDACVALG